MGLQRRASLADKAMEAGIDGMVQQQQNAQKIALQAVMAKKAQQDRCADTCEAVQADAPGGMQAQAEALWASTSMNTASPALQAELAHIKAMIKATEESLAAYRKAENI